MTKIEAADVMKDIMTGDGYKPLVLGDLLEGTVITTSGITMYIDLGVYGTGIIYGREFLNAKDMIKNINVGDTVKGKVIETENENGYVELSLKEARQALVWSDADKIMKSGEILELPVKEANKGGLMVEWQGIQGFLPASQLKAEHYPRVDDGDKDEILKNLKNSFQKNYHLW